MKTTLSAFLALSALAPRAAAEALPGQHVIIGAIGGATPAGDVNVLHAVDLDRDNRNESLEINKRAGAVGVSGFVQYTYHPWQSLAFGVDVAATGFGSLKNEVSLAGLPRTGGLNFAATTGGSVRTEGTLVQYLAIAKWVALPEKLWNPYLFGGLGFNTFTASSKFDPNANTPWADTGTHEERELYNRNSAGVAASLGGGLQWSVGDLWMVGLEGRWNYSGVDSNDFGVKSVNSASGYAWAGVRFGL